MIAALLIACRLDAPPVVVIGGGPAGLAAALEASAGAEVVLYEGSDRLGGSALYGQAITAAPAGSALHTEGVEWLSGLGVRWDPARDPSGAGEELLRPRGGGPAAIAPLAERVQTVAAIHLGERVVGLRRDGGAWVVELAGGTSRRAAAVILATGGFMGAPRAARARMALPEEGLLRGAPAFADGGGLELAASVGGSVPFPADGLLYAHGTPAPDDPERALMIVESERGWVLDTSGVARPGLASVRGAAGMALQALPGATAWFVAAGPRARRTPLYDWEAQRMVPGGAVMQRQGLWADDAATLAAKLSVPVEALADLPRPMGALPLLRTTAKALSGLRTDADGRVLDETGAPIEGLLAAGEVAGFGRARGPASADSTMVIGAVVSGRRAGRAAVSR